MDIKVLQSKLSYFETPETFINNFSTVYLALAFVLRDLKGDKSYIVIVNRGTDAFVFI